MKARTAVAVLLTAVILVASGPAVLAGDPGRPWFGHAEGQSWFDLGNPKDCEALITTRVDEPAFATHFGAGRIVLSHCPTGIPDDNFADADLVLIAADGDRVFGTYVGTMVLPPEMSVGDIITGTIQLTVTGGTGRFEGASGGATMEYWAIFEGWEDYSWAWGASWRGKLSY